MTERKPPIIEGHDGGACFWIMPVRCQSKVCFGWDAVDECESAEVSLDEEDVFAFLKPFFYQFFDKELSYNQLRKEDWSGAKNVCIPPEFEWNLTYNFYERNTMQHMLKEIATVADKMEYGGFFDIDSSIVRGYSVDSFFDIDYQNTPESEYEKVDISTHLHVAVDFYRRFVARIKRMLDENPEWPLISIMGP